MSTAPPAPPTAPAGAPAPAGPVPAATAPVATAKSSTPVRLRSLQLVLAVAAVALGLVLVVAANGRAGSIDKARRAADLVVATQELRAAMGRADAASVGAFLSGGVDQPTQRERYNAAIAEATQALQDAGRVVDDEAGHEAVTRLGQLLPTYTGLIETARADNRQQLPLGAAYLRSAAQLARSDITVQLNTLAAAGDASFREEQDTLTGGVGAITVAVAVAVLVVFALGARWLAGRTRRLLNPGLVAAGVVLVAGLGWVASSTGSSATKGVTAIRNGYDQLAALSAIRAAAYESQSSATFALIDRGARDTFNARAETGAQNVLALLDGVDNPSELPGLWQRYVDRSKAATQLDADGDYDGARAAMTAGIDDGSSIAAGFEAFDQAVLARVGSAETQFGFDLINARSPVARIRIAGLVIGVVAAAAAAWGVQRRINDYR